MTSPAGTTGVGAATVGGAMTFSVTEPVALVAPSLPVMFVLPLPTTWAMAFVTVATAVFEEVKVK
jgi:hypothetical protein